MIPGRAAGAQPASLRRPGGTRLRPRQAAGHVTVRVTSLHDHSSSSHGWTQTPPGRVRMADVGSNLAMPPGPTAAAAAAPPRMIKAGRAGRDVVHGRRGTGTGIVPNH